MSMTYVNNSRDARNVGNSNSRRFLNSSKEGGKSKDQWKHSIRRDINNTTDASNNIDARAQTPATAGTPGTMTAERIAATEGPTAEQETSGTSENPRQQ